MHHAFHLLIPCAGMVLSGTSAHAQITWQHTYGGLGHEVGHDGCQAADGGSFICGSTGSFGTGGGDVYLFKVDQDGQRLWSRAFGGAGVEQGWGIARVPQGGLIVAGVTNSFGAGGYDGYMLRTDDEGGLLWERSVGTTDWDLLYDVAALDDGFLFAGQTYASGGGDLWLVRTDLSGDTLWTRHSGGSGTDEARCVEPTPDGGCVIAGTISTPDSGLDAVLVKYDAMGAVEWTTLIGGAQDDVGMTVTPLADGGYVVGGYSRSFGPVQGMLLGKVDADGGLVWEKCIVSESGIWEGHDIRELPDGHLVMLGFTNAYGGGGTDFYLLFTDAEGAFVGGPTYGGEGDEQGWALDLTTDGGYLLVGSSMSFGPGISAVFVVRSAGDVLSGPIVPYMDPLPVREITLPTPAVYPDPVAANGDLSVALPEHGPIHAVFMDLQGRVCSASEHSMGPSIHVPDLSPGVYLLSIDQADRPLLRTRITVQ